MFEKKKKEEEAPESKGIYLRTVHEGDSNVPSIVVYECDRCLKMISMDYTEADAKEIFDVHELTGHVLCPKCREEFEKFKSKPFKVRISIRYGHVHGDLVETVEDVFTNTNEAWAYVALQDKKIIDKIAQGYTLKDKERNITYIPYAERKA